MALPVLQEKITKHKMLNEFVFAQLNIIKQENNMTSMLYTLYNTNYNK